MRIGGLASGIDTESVIDSMMQAHRIPLNKITQKKQYAEWQLDDYRSVNRDIRTFRDDLFDKNLTRQSTYMAKTVNVSNENAVGIRAMSANSEFSGEIEVTKLARSASWQMTEEKTDVTHISELIKDNQITIQTPADKNPITITFENDETIESAISRINKEANVSAFFDERSGRISMTAKHSGEGDIIVKGFKDTINSEKVSGQDAVFTLNGMKDMKRSSNTFEINGFEFTLKDTTVDKAPVTFSSAPDVDKVYDSVMEFVNGYNELIEKLNDKIKEQKFRDFHPLSEEEKADMKEKEIELWEEKAMSGTLRNDPTIQSFLQKMRTVLSNGVDDGEGGKMILSEIGITTSRDYLANGKLEVDETKLREAIASNPNKVYDLLGSAGTEEKGKGLVHGLRDAMRDANEAISKRAGNSGAANESFILGRNIKEMDNQIERFEARMKQMEERYWREFTAMEKAMSRAQSQADQLMNALSGMMM